MNKRIFTFGCSYTRWNWPTWADIIHWEHRDIEFENLGAGGLGNVGIMHRMVECDIKNKFTPDDLILVVWSHWNREDRFFDGEWKTVGNVFGDCENFYSKEFVRKYWSFQNDIVKNSTAIISANKMFDINFQGHIMPIASFETHSELAAEADYKILDFYKELIPNKHYYYSTEHFFSEPFNELVQDGHPSILSHLDYVEKYIYPTLNLQLKPSTIQICKTLQSEIMDELVKVKIGSNDHQVVWDIVEKIVVEKHRLTVGNRQKDPSAFS